MALILFAMTARCKGVCGLIDAKLFECYKTSLPSKMNGVYHFGHDSEMQLCLQLIDAIQRKWHY